MSDYEILYVMNRYIDIISVKTQHNLCTSVQYYTTPCFGPSLGHLQVVP